MKVIERMKEKGGVLIGMVHCLPLPGTMNYGGSMDAIVDKATEDAHALETAGFDAVLVEATMDKPMGMVRGPLQLAAMSVICGAVHRAVHIPMGVSYLTPDCRDVFSIAKASGADFVRITAFVDTLHFPVGTVQPCAVQAWEVRREGNMQDISILADIQVKHAELVYPQTTLEQSAYLAQAQGADAIVVTGNATGEETADGNHSPGRQGVQDPNCSRQRRCPEQCADTNGAGARIYCWNLREAGRQPDGAH